MAISRPPIETPVMEGKHFSKPWVQHLQQVQLAINTAPIYFELGGVQQIDPVKYPPTKYPIGSRVHLPAAGKFFTATSSGWIEG